MIVGDSQGINSSTGLISGTIASGDSANSPYTVTLTASDALGNSSRQQFIWNVNPTNLDPVVSNPGAQINTQGDVFALQIQATDPAGNGLTYTATGLPPGLTIDASSGLISGVLSSNNASGSPYSVTVTATDGTYSGNTTFTWSVTNQAVTVTNPGTQNSTGGNAASLQISASDPAQLPLTYAASGLPDGLSINASSGLISGTLASTDGGAYAVTVMASDSQGNSGSAAFTWNVTYVNQAPTLDNPGDQLDKTGDVVSLSLFGYDVDGDTVTYSATGLPSGLSINSTTGVISGTLPASAASSTPYSVTVTASDGTLHASQTFNWFVTANVVTLSSPGDQTNTEGDTVSLQLSAADSDSLSLTYQASGLPSGLSLNSSTGLISGMITSGDSANGPYTFTVSATDTQGNSSAQQITWNVNAPSNALTLTNPGNQSNAEADNVSLQVQASDPDGDTLEYAASGLPIGLMIDPTTGLISGAVDYSAAEISGGQYNVAVTVNDGNGQTVSQSLLWTIADTPQAPWLEYPTFQNSQSGAAVSLQLVGGSPDGKTLTYSATGLPAGLSVNSSTRLINGTITAAMGSYTVTAQVSDGTLTASQTFTWHVPCESAPQVLISFDGQPVGEDYLAGVDPSTPFPVTLTLEHASAGLHTITLSIPSGESEVSQSSFQLADGGSETVEMTPEEVSQSFDDDLLVAYVDGEEGGDGEDTNAKVTIGAVNATDTPTGMKPRITMANGNANHSAPYTKVAMTITPTLKEEKVIVFQVPDNSDSNGTANLLNVDDLPVGRVWGQSSGSLYVVGLNQTAPPGPDGKSHAGNLSIVAYKGTKNANRMIATVDTTAQQAKSAGFSVAAIPIQISMRFQMALTNGTITVKTSKPSGISFLWGARYQYTVKSDSFNPRDLDKVSTMKQVVRGERTGPFKKLPTERQQAPRSALAVPAPDDLVLSVLVVVNNLPQNAADIIALAKKLQPTALAGILKLINDNGGEGTSDSDQYFIFSDDRTGLTMADKVVVKNSGFHHKFQIKKNGGSFELQVVKTPLANHGASAGDIPLADQKAPPVTFK